MAQGCLPKRGQPPQHRLPDGRLQGHGRGPHRDGRGGGLLDKIMEKSRRSRSYRSLGGRAPACFCEDDADRFISLDSVSISDISCLSTTVTNSDSFCLSMKTTPSRTSSALDQRLRLGHLLPHEERLRLRQLLPLDQSIRLGQLYGWSRSG